MKQNYTPWKTDKWFVSPWNYIDEIKAEVSFPSKIILHDITLRDGEQQAGIVFTKDEKVTIAEKLAEIGVQRIEAGMPAVSYQDEEAIKEIVKRNLGPKIFCFSRCLKQDIKRAYECGADGVVVEIPSSEHIIRYAYKWPLEKAIDLSVEATSYAKELGLYTVFFPIDGSRAEFNWFLNLIERVAKEGHMDALTLVDTFGGCSPHTIPLFVRKIKERINKPLEAHFHNDFGLATANTILALASGAEVAHVTISSLGERAGNASLEEVVLILLTMYGIDVNIKYNLLYEISMLIRDLSKVNLPPNHPVVGDMIFKVESGIIAGWLREVGEENCLEVFPFKWDLVGHKHAEIVLGKGSGLSSIEFYLSELGETLNQNQKELLVREVKDFSISKKDLLTIEEFKMLVKGIKKKEVK